MKLFIQFVFVFLIMLFLFYVLLTGGKAVIDGCILCSRKNYMAYNETLRKD